MAGGVPSGRLGDQQRPARAKQSAFIYTELLCKENTTVQGYLLGSAGHGCENGMSPIIAAHTATRRSEMEGEKGLRCLPYQPSLRDCRAKRGTCGKGIPRKEELGKSSSPEVARKYHFIHRNGSIPSQNVLATTGATSFHPKSQTPCLYGWKCSKCRRG